MADDIVVLSDSDEENAKSSWSRESTPTTLASAANKNQHGKRKNSDEEAPAAKRPTFYAESPTNSSEQRANCSTPKLPQIVAVETLATPSATPPLQLLASPPRNTNTPKDTRPIVSAEVDAAKSSKDSLRRIKLTTVLKGSDDAWQQARQKRLQTSSSGSRDLQSPAESNSAASSPPVGVMDLTHSPLEKTKEEKPENKTVEIETNPALPTNAEGKRPLEKEFEELIEVCRKADSSADMQKLIDTKLLKYYYGVHPDFVKSRGFRKTVGNCTERIRAEPDLVYYNLKAVVDELNVRRKSKDVIITNEEASPNASSSNGAATPISKHTEEQIKKLNKALYILKKRIFRLEEAEVDLDDDNSAFLQVERYKKRACQIYEKICDLTGESKTARRLVKKPIQFSGTSYPAFNKTLQAYINRTKEFPDFFDVLRMMEHCNRQYDLKLANFEMKRIAQDAFLKVGKILQSRRKTDLYEMVSHFTNNLEDPAKSDPDLLAKLNENQKTQTSISKVLETYARAQDDPVALEQLQNDGKASKTTQENGDGSTANHLTTAAASNENNKVVSDDDSDDDDDEEDDEELDVHVDKLTKDNTIDLSDEEIELEETTPALAKEINATSQVESDKSKELADHKLTENNNILRAKTNSVVVAETRTSVATANVPTNVAANKKVEISALSDVAVPKTTIASHNLTLLENSKACKDNNATASSVKIPVATKTAPKDPKLLRTIAEIVISDEE